ncbi:hypothetical protein G3T36_06505 [Diaminobutyricibacter tongyongensis]|uniref:Uncharacterized protein n=1 Tax=Leifsonia tongyongensis TaxID=1268043 RepID=A0A6L9XVS5_9MICO|nr:hypothetical protein [Diaminobutyricibacter tongyongensis]NEN05519.1 hypothetical protein [Diaminobutyricibacter tongyongensis]
MHLSRKKLFVPAVVAITIALGGGLAGCSTGSTSGSSSTASAGASSDTATIPSSFPKSDVPIVDGKILVAKGDASTGWSVTVIPTSKTGFADAKAALEKAGFKAEPNAKATDTSTTIFDGPKYTVILSTPGQAVTYAVSPV